MRKIQSDLEMLNDIIAHLLDLEKSVSDPQLKEVLLKVACEVEQESDPKHFSERLCTLLDKALESERVVWAIVERELRTRLTLRQVLEELASL